MRARPWGLDGTSLCLWPVPLPSSAGCGWGAVGPLSMGMDLREQPRACLTLLREKLWDLGSSHKVGIHSLLPVHSCNVALQVSEKEGGKSSEEKGGEEGGHAGEEPVPRWEWGGGS